MSYLCVCVCVSVCVCILFVSFNYVDSTNKQKLLQMIFSGVEIILKIVAKSYSQEYVCKGLDIRSNTYNRNDKNSDSNQKRRNCNNKKQ